MVEQTEQGLEKLAIAYGIDYPIVDYSKTDKRNVTPIGKPIVIQFDNNLPEQLERFLIEKKPQFANAYVLGEEKRVVGAFGFSVTRYGTRKIPQYINVPVQYYRIINP
ncbi:MAG: hypothetical protein AABW41_03820 [Nanoarchaeota archaeon]